MFSSREFGARWSVVLVAALISALAAGCGSSGSGKSDGKPITVGASLPLTGSESEPGKAAGQGYQVWEKLVNKNGGLLDGRKVKVVIKDDASNQNTVVADYNSLISREKVDLLLGTFSSLLNLPASAVAERNKMLFVEPAGGAPELFSRGFKYLFFSQQTTADKAGDAFAEWLTTSAPSSVRPKTAAYPIQDDPFTKPTIEGMRKKFEAAGVRTVYRKLYPASTTNFDGIAAAMKGTNADMVVNGSIFEDGVGVVRALRKASYKPKWLFQTTAPSLGAQYAKGVGAQNTEGIAYNVSYSQAAKTTGNAEFVKKYGQMFGSGDIPEDAADAYAAGQILQAAVKSVGSVARSDQSKLADFLRKNTVQTILGPISWDSAGRPQSKFLIGQWQSGRVQTILPKSLATTKKIVLGWSPR